MVVDDPHTEKIIFPSFTFGRTSGSFLPTRPVRIKQAAFINSNKSMWQEAVVKTPVGDRRSKAGDLERCLPLKSHPGESPGMCSHRQSRETLEFFEFFTKTLAPRQEMHHPLLTVRGEPPFTALEMGWDLSTVPEPLPKKPNSREADCYFTERNCQKFPQIQAKPAARGSSLSMGSPKGDAPEPSELQGQSAAHYHRIHGKIQQLFKCYSLCCIST